MKQKLILGLFALCVMALVPTSALADTPTPYERLQSEVVRFENLAEIAFEEYTSTVVPDLIGDRDYWKLNDFSTEAIRSAELLGPFPIFLALTMSERFNTFESHINNKVERFYDTDELVSCFRHSGHDGGSGWLFIAMIDDKPITLFELWEDADSFHTFHRYNIDDANAAYTAYQKLARSSVSEKFILFVERERFENPDIFFTDDSNKLAFFSEPDVEYPLVTYVEFVCAAEKAASQASAPRMDKSFTRFLFEEEPPAVRQPTFLTLGLVFGVIAAFLGAALFFSAQKWQKHTVP